MCERGFKNIAQFRPTHARKKKLPTYED